MKKIFKVLLTIALGFVSVAPMTLHAQEGSALMNIISGMNEGTSDFRAYNSNNTDVTTDFLAVFGADFSAFDEETVKDYMLDNGVYLKRRIVNEIPTPFGATFTRCYVAEEFAEVLAQTSPVGAGAIIITYLVTADPIYILETGTVVTNPQPVATLTSADCPLLLVKIFSFSSMTSLSADQKTITYNWTFQVRGRRSQYVDVYDAVFERVNRSMMITPSTY